MPDSQANKTMIDVALLNQSQKDVKDSLNRLEGIVKEGNDRSSAQNIKIIADIAVMVSKQEGYSDYQKECDKERKELDKKIDEKIAETWKQININTNKISQLMTRNAVIAIIVSTAIMALPEIYKMLK